MSFTAAPSTLNPWQGLDNSDQFLQLSYDRVRAICEAAPLKIAIPLLLRRMTDGFRQRSWTTTVRHIATMLDRSRRCIQIALRLLVKTGDILQRSKSGGRQLIFSLPAPTPDAEQLLRRNQVRPEQPLRRSQDHPAQPFRRSQDRGGAIPGSPYKETLIYKKDPPPSDLRAEHAHMREEASRALSEEEDFSSSTGQQACTSNPKTGDVTQHDPKSTAVPNTVFEDEGWLTNDHRNYPDSFAPSIAEPLEPSWCSNMDKAVIHPTWSGQPEASRQTPPPSRPAEISDRPSRTVEAQTNDGSNSEDRGRSTVQHSAAPPRPSVTSSTKRDPARHRWPGADLPALVPGIDRMDPATIVEQWSRAVSRSDASASIYDLSPSSPATLHLSSRYSSANLSRCFAAIGEGVHKPWGALRSMLGGTWTFVAASKPRPKYGRGYQPPVPKLTYDPAPPPLTEADRQCIATSEAVLDALRAGFKGGA